MPPEKNTDKPISAVEFTPMAAPEIDPSASISPSFLGILALGCVAAVIMVLLYLSKPVIFKVDPVDADIDVSGLSFNIGENYLFCLLYTSPSPRDRQKSRMPSSA